MGYPTLRINAHQTASTQPGDPNNIGQMVQLNKSDGSPTTRRFHIGSTPEQRAGLDPRYQPGVGLISAHDSLNPIARKSNWDAAFNNVTPMATPPSSWADRQAQQTARIAQIRDITSPRSITAPQSETRIAGPIIATPPVAASPNPVQAPPQMPVQTPLAAPVVNPPAPTPRPAIRSDMAISGPIASRANPIMQPAPAPLAQPAQAPQALPTDTPQLRISATPQPAPNQLTDAQMAVKNQPLLALHGRIMDETGDVTAQTMAAGDQNNPNTVAAQMLLKRQAAQSRKPMQIAAY